MENTSKDTRHPPLYTFTFLKKLYSDVSNHGRFKIRTGDLTDHDLLLVLHDVVRSMTSSAIVAAQKIKIVKASSGGVGAKSHSILCTLNSLAQTAIDRTSCAIFGFLVWQPQPWSSFVHTLAEDLLNVFESSATCTSSTTSEERWATEASANAPTPQQTVVAPLLRGVDRHSTYAGRDCYLFFNTLTVAQPCQNDRKGSGHPKGPRPEHTPMPSPLGKRQAHLLQGKHQGPARPPTGQHAPGLPPAGGNQISHFPFESLTPVAAISFGLTASLERAIVVWALKFKGIAGRLHTDAFETRRVPCSCQQVG